MAVERMNADGPGAPPGTGRVAMVLKAAAWGLMAAGLTLLLLIVIRETWAAPQGFVKTKIAGETFYLELAVTPGQRSRGLGGREELPEDEGMLFVFDDMAVRSFWMKDCLIPLDIAFLDSEGRVVRMHTMEPPEPGTPDSELRSYSSFYPAQYAIEVNAGVLEELGVEAGDRINLPQKALKGGGGGVDDTQRESTTAGAGAAHGPDTAD